jgi:hypothetical protein
MEINLGRADSRREDDVDYGAAVPYASLRGGADASRKGFYVRWAVICATATAVLAVVAWKGGGGAEKFTTGEEGSSLDGAYYAVAKPPAFNFNREHPFPKEMWTGVSLLTSPCCSGHSSSTPLLPTGFLCSFASPTKTNRIHRKHLDIRWSVIRPRHRGLHREDGEEAPLQVECEMHLSPPL